MPPPVPHPSAEFIALTDLHLADELDECGMRRWESLLMSEPHAARYYAELAATEALLTHELDTRSRRPVSPVPPVPAWRVVLFRRVAPALGAAAAVAVVVAAGLRLRVAEPAPAPLRARLVNALNARWENGSVAVGAALPAAEAYLKSGYAELSMPSGAMVRLKAPARIAVTGANALRLTEGALTAEVPPAATGFAVEAPYARVVDVSTRFGVAVSPAREETAVGVLQGEVALERDGASTLLHGGEEVRCTRSARLAEPLRPEDFPVSLPDREFVWQPQGATVSRFDVSALVDGPGEYRVLLKWIHGAAAFPVKAVTLRRDGVPVFTQATDIVAGSLAAARNNLFALTLPEGTPSGGRWELELCMGAGVSSEGRVGFERAPERLCTAADITGRWAYTVRGSRYVREFRPDGGFRLYRDGQFVSETENAGYRVESGVVHVFGCRRGIEELHVLRDDGALVFVNCNYPDARRE